VRGGAFYVHPSSSRIAHFKLKNGVNGSLYKVDSLPSTKIEKSGKIKIKTKSKPNIERENAWGLGLAVVGEAQCNRSTGV